MEVQAPVMSESAAAVAPRRKPHVLAARAAHADSSIILKDQAKKY
ncbi:MAG TPA: hypothetical protein VMJ11_20905 [Paraburkholderia sp.]|nr:hypothetical protein [Paraburkholderia sp.]HTR09063.1 hypothetical protein [Paraburkholderia sp.]